MLVRGIRASGPQGEPPGRSGPARRCRRKEAGLALRRTAVEHGSLPGGTTGCAPGRRAARPRDNPQKGRKASQSTSCPTGFKFGANGIALVDGAIIISNMENASITKITKNPDRTAGMAVPVVASNCMVLSGADGIAASPQGLFVAGNLPNAIDRVGMDGSVTTLLQGPELDFPTSLSYLPSPMVDSLYVTNASFIKGTKPGLIQIELTTRGTGLSQGPR